MYSQKEKKRIVSGIKPSGRPHLGNYFGMMKRVIEMQEKYETFLFIADYHAMTSIRNSEDLKKLTEELVLDYLAIGLNPEKTVFYLQSAIPELTELAWFFSTLSSISWLERAHAYKDARAKKSDISLATFSYPILMASDILSLRADFVPVGKDQIQHIEMTREIARKMNKYYGSFFKEPKELIEESSAILPGIDGRKMSKSYGNTIPLFAPEEEIKKRVMKIVTDSSGVDEKKNPDTCTIFALHRYVTPSDELEEIRNAYLSGKMGYGESKKRLFHNILSYTKKMREKRRSLEGKRNEIRAILEHGNKRAREEIVPFVYEIKKAVGLFPFQE